MSMADKVFVFIDLDNIYRGILEHYGLELIEEGFNFFDELRSIQKSKDNIISEIYAYGDFSKLGSSSFRTKLAMEGIQISDVFSTNGSINRKNASDIELSIGAVDCAYTLPEINKYLLISADSDMISIINYLKSRHRKQVSLYVLGKQAKVDILSKFPNDDFQIIEKVFKLKEPEIISDEEIESNLELIVKRILGTEQYNISAKRDRIYNTVEGYRWNEMRFLKLNKKRIHGKSINKVISYLEIKKIIDIKYNKDIKSEEIILNRENDIVKKLLTN